MRADNPERILEVRPFRIRLLTFIAAFQMIEMLVVFPYACLNQSRVLEGEIYLDTATFVHRLQVLIKSHPSFSANALEKTSSLFIPQPPHYLGRARVSHLAHAKILLGYFPFQRNRQQIFCNLSSIPLGIQANVIKYIGVASRIALIKTNLPAVDKYLWYHTLRCLSTLVISQIQSAILYP